MTRSVKQRRFRMSSTNSNRVTVHGNLYQPPRWVSSLSARNRLPLIIITLLWVIIWSFMVDAAQVYQTNSLFVYQPSGAMHCEPNSGIGLSTMGQQLTEAGIKVISMHIGFYGREGVAICGAPSGEINIYEIPASKINTALRISFKRLSVNINNN